MNFINLDNTFESENISHLVWGGTEIYGGAGRSNS